MDNVSWFSLVAIPLPCALVLAKAVSVGKPLLELASIRELPKAAMHRGWLLHGCLNRTNAM